MDSKNLIKKITLCCTIFLLTISFIFLIGCNSLKNNLNNDLKRSNLYGKIKTIRKIKYDVVEKFGKISKGKIWDSYWNNDFTIFNKDGNLVELNRFKPNGNLEYKSISKYDNRGNRMGSFIYNSDGSIRSKIISKFDDKGNNIEEFIYNSDGSLDKKQIRKFDDKGNYIESVMIGSDGVLRLKLTFKYDDKGNTIGISNFNSDGILKFKSTYIPDDRGNDIEKYVYNSNGSLIHKSVYNYEFDKHGNWIKRFEYKQKNSESKLVPKSITEREIEYY